MEGTDLIRLGPGAKVTCEKGHYICTTIHELIAGSDRPLVSPEWFANFGPEHYQPGPGDKADKCVCGICGAPWIDERPGLRPDGTRVLLAKLHLEHGWWP